MFITCSHLRSDVLYKNESIARDEEDGTLYNKGFTSQSIIFHGYKGTRQWQINWCTSSINDTQNYPFCRLQLVVETFGYST